MKSRPTTYNGIDMRSRLEARAAALFDAHSWTWVYEPQCYASGSEQWLPDFRLEFSESSSLVEVKPSVALRERDKLLNRMMVTAWPSEPSATVLLMFGPDEVDGWWFTQSLMQIKGKLVFRAGWLNMDRKVLDHGLVIWPQAISLITQPTLVEVPA